MEMALREASAGPLEGRVVTLKAVSTWTDPAADDLVVQDTSGNYVVAEAADTDLPKGVVRSVDADSVKLAVELFTSGTIARLPYSGTPSLGQQIQAASATEVKGVASGGVGTIVAKDMVSGYVDVLF